MHFEIQFNIKGVFKFIPCYGKSYNTPAQHTMLYVQEIQLPPPSKVFRFFLKSEGKEVERNKK